jgi:hypothetical protein
MKKSLTIITILILTTILASCASNPGENVRIPTNRFQLKKLKR